MKKEEEPGFCLLYHIYLINSLCTTLYNLHLYMALCTSVSRLQQPVQNPLSDHSNILWNSPSIGIDFKYRLP